MQCVNAIRLLNLPTSCTCTLCRPVGAVFFSFSLKDIFASMLAHYVVSRLPFLETKTVLVQAFMYETQVFFSFALEFTTLALSINST